MLGNNTVGMVGKKGPVRQDWNLISGPAWEEYTDTIRSSRSLQNARYNLVNFLSDDTVKMDAQSLIDLGRKNPKEVEEIVKRYILKHKARVQNKEIAGASMNARVTAARLFLTMSDVIQINWKKLSKIAPPSRKSGNDRAPTLEELQQVDKYADARLKFVLSAMVSGGFRLGGWLGLKVRDFEPIERNSQIVACKVTIYRGEPEQYTCFISPEAYQRFQAYQELRRKARENVTGDSPALRNQFSMKRRISPVTPLSYLGIYAMFKRGWHGAGFRLTGSKYEFKLVHSLRKVYKTRAEQCGMKPVNVEMLMGHSTGLSDSYYKPTERELLDDYLKAVDALNIDPTNRIGEVAKSSELEEARREIERLKQNQNTKLKDMEKQIEDLTKLVEARLRQNSP